jgi:hypothetical protein
LDWRADGGALVATGASDRWASAAHDAAAKKLMKVSAMIRFVCIFFRLLSFTIGPAAHFVELCV